MWKIQNLSLPVAVADCLIGKIINTVCAKWTMAPIRDIKAVVHILNKFGAGQKKLSNYMYIISGQGRKSGGAPAPGALPSLAPLQMEVRAIWMNLYFGLEARFFKIIKAQISSSFTLPLLPLWSYCVYSKKISSDFQKGGDPQMQNMHLSHKTDAVVNSWWAKKFRITCN